MPPDPEPAAPADTASVTAEAPDADATRSGPVQQPPTEPIGITSVPLTVAPWAGVASGTEAAVADPAPLASERWAAAGWHETPPEQPAVSATSAGSHAVPPEPARSDGGPGWLGWVLLGLAVAAVAVLGVSDAVRFSDNHKSAGFSRQTLLAVSAAVRVATPLLSYDYRTISGQPAQLAPLLTPSCAAQYATTINTVVKPLAVAHRAVLTATVRSAGVRTASAKEVTVLIFADLDSTNDQRSGTRLDQTQVSLDMLHEHGQWLLDSAVSNGSGGTGAQQC